MSELHATALLRARPLVVWEAHHDNGWITVIAEQPDGSFAAWASDGGASRVDYVGEVAHAHAAVMAALRWKSGHRRCSVQCSDWRMRLVEHGPASDEAGTTANVG